MTAAVGAVGGLWDRIQQTAANLGVKIYKNTMAGQDLLGMVRLAPEHMQRAIAGFGDTHRAYLASGDALNAINAKGMTPFWNLKTDIDKTKVNNALLSSQNRWGIDGRKPWADYTQYHDAPNKAELMALHTKLTNEINSLRTTGALPAFESHSQDASDCWIFGECCPSTDVDRSSGQNFRAADACGIYQRT